MNTRKAVESSQRLHGMHEELVGGGRADDDDDKRAMEAATATHLSPGVQKRIQHEVVQAALEGDADRIVGLLQSTGVRNMQQSLRESGVGPGFLPLHKAISGFHFHGSKRLTARVLQVLVDHGADVNTQDESGGTALHKVLQVRILLHVTTAHLPWRTMDTALRYVLCAKLCYASCSLLCKTTSRLLGSSAVA